MGLLQTLRSGVKVVDRAVKSLEPTVQFERFTGQNAFGEKSYSAPISLKAIVEDEQQQIRTFSGELSQSKTSILFLDAKALLSATSNQGVKEDDRITLQNGDTGPILNVGGFVDAGTGIPIATQVYMG